MLAQTLVRHYQGPSCKTLRLQDTLLRHSCQMHLQCIPGSYVCAFLLLRWFSDTGFMVMLCFGGVWCMGCGHVFVGFLFWWCFGCVLVLALVVFCFDSGVWSCFSGGVLVAVFCCPCSSFLVLFDVFGSVLVHGRWCFGGVLPSPQGIASFT